MPPASSNSQPVSRLKRLIDYYLACLKNDDGTPVVVAASQMSSRLAAIGWSDGSAELQDSAGALLEGDDDAVLLIGWPVLGIRAQGRMHLVPVVLQEVESIDGTQSISSTEDPPRLNPALFAGLGPRWTDEDRASLDQHLGLAPMDDASVDGFTPVSFEEACRRLPEHALFAEHDLLWLGELREVEPNAALTNSIVVVRTEQSQYTKTLRRELAEIRERSRKSSFAEVLAGTALGVVLSSDAVADGSSADDLVLEVNPLSPAQRESAQHALTAQLTTITGPPGTGKSQVVSAIVASQVGRDASVLVASKNHKAVEVVQERVDQLAGFAVVNRVGRGRDGKRNYTQEAAERAHRLLGTRAGSGDPVADLQQERRRAKDAIAAHEGQRRRQDDAGQRVESARAARDEAIAQIASHDASRIMEAQHLPDSAAISNASAAFNGSGSLWYRLVSWRADRRIVEGLRASLGHSAGALPPIPDRPFLAVSAPEWRAWLDDACKLVTALQAEQQLRDARVARDALGSRGDLAERMNTERERLLETSRRLLHQKSARPAISSEAREDLAVWAGSSDDITSGRASGRGYYDARRRMNAAFPRILGALPAWASTNLSVGGTVPLEPGIFDLVVIDEASQCDIASAIPLLFRARRAAVIGDPHQLRHVAHLDPKFAFELLERFELDDVERSAWRYDTRSIYDVAQYRSAPVTLDWHFRSHPDIIRISNETWYGGALEVHSDPSALAQLPDRDLGIAWADTVGSARRGFGGTSWCSENEARAVVDTIGEILELGSSWKGTVGVVSPFAAQATLISSLAKRRFGDAVLEEVQFVAGTAHRLQGDERDVVVMSPCLQDGLGKGAQRFIETQSNLLNVAISRARAHLIVVGNRSACRASTAEALRRLADHQPSELDVAGDTWIGPGEQVLADALSAAGIAIEQQHAIGPYRVDIAVIDEASRIAIEVDGAAFHLGSDGMQTSADVVRDFTLVGRGWQVVRFWHDEVMSDPDGCVEQIRALCGDWSEAHVSRSANEVFK